MDKLAELKELHESIRACTKCDLHKTATQKVIVRGKLHPKILFVGEAPGADEDKQGKPFVGLSGKLLDKYLDEAGIKDFAISNILKERPPGNAKPTLEQIEACAPWLEKQIEIMKPKIIICLGDTALKHFLPNSGSISSCEGKLLNNLYFPIMHPAYYLRNRDQIDRFGAHLKEAKKISEKAKDWEEHPSVNYQIAKNDGNFEMISPELAVIHRFCKETGLDFVDVNQKDKCKIDGVPTTLILKDSETSMKTKQGQTRYFLEYSIDDGRFRLESLFVSDGGLEPVAQPLTNIIRIEKQEEEAFITPQRYVPLHLHTEHSVGDGVGQCSVVVRELKKKGFRASAITDHGTLQGTIYFQKECLAQGIKPLLGCELYVIDPDEEKQRVHAVAIAKNEQGWKNLMKLQHIANTEHFYYKPRITFDELLQYHEGLIVSTACVHGIISLPIIEGNLERAEERVIKLKKAYGDDFYLELMPNSLEEQKKVNIALGKLAQKHNIECIITTDAHYPNKEDKIVHDAIKAISMRKKYGEAGFSDDVFYQLKDEEILALMRRNHPTIPEELVERCMANTIEVAKKCNFTISRIGEDTLPQVFSEIYEPEREQFAEWKRKAVEDPEKVRVLTFHEKVEDE